MYNVIWNKRSKIIQTLLFIQVIKLWIIILVAKLWTGACTDAELGILANGSSSNSRPGSLDIDHYLSHLPYTNFLQLIVNQD
jgi:hypothetical protein